MFLRIYPLLFDSLCDVENIQTRDSLLIPDLKKQQFTQSLHQFAIESLIVVPRTQIEH